MILILSLQTLVAGWFALYASLAQAQRSISCEADFSPLHSIKHRVELKPLENGQFAVSLNHQLQPQSASFVSETVRDKLNLLVDPNGAEFASYNSAERSLGHIHQLQRMSQIGSAQKLDIPFELNQVKTIKTMNLTGKMDKFGGTVLLEAYDADQQLLGRVFRKVFIAACR